MKTKIILSSILLLIIHFSAFGNDTISLYRKDGIYICFTEKDTTMHFFDNAKMFYLKKTNDSRFFSYTDLHNLFPCSVELIDSFDSLLYFSYSFEFSMQGSTYITRRFFKYNRKASKLYYLPLRGHEGGNYFNYMQTRLIQGCPYKETIKLKKRKGKVYMYVKTVFYYCDYNNPSCVVQKR